MTMVLGVLSDSHGDAAATARAVAVLETHGAEFLIHCGDICSPAVLDQLAGHRACFVFGNCDTPDASWRDYVRTLGLEWPEAPLRLELGGRRIGVAHGHERAFRALLNDPELDYLFFGHTHVYSDRRIGRLRAINPGALHRARTRTVARVDLATDELTFLTLDGYRLDDTGVF
ncbi:MAG: YfcE family phosphodiesterase [Phycisphaerae bacterium]|nr:YfcE family phosphodiesterase [Phycisphaerae bacterium]NUQ46024.1 YfcE family phosphodiesterase [Phycisphaerae bacterium]